MSDEILTQFDNWLGDESEVAALIMRQWLEPVEGKDAIIFPATYAKPEGMRDEDWLGYNIDPRSGPGVCQIDSVGSQANRMEPIFMRDGYRNLVPNVVITARFGGQDKKVNLLEAGHRAADAIVRFSPSLAKEFGEAFNAIKERGDAEPLARLAPTSLVFGVWDSRGSGVKLPRIVRSVIRAYDASPVHRSAQYIPPVDYVGEGVLERPQNKTEEKSMSELGLNHAPAPWTHGGVQIRGEIRRDASLNLAALRALRVLAKDSLPLRRYVLGLALIAFTAPQETFLREGCQLVPDLNRPAEWNLVRHDGMRELLKLSHDQASEYARQAAVNFKVGENREAAFDAKTARAALAQSKEERKKARRNEHADQDGTK
jgi:CRISPR-associated protein Csb1